MIIGYKKGLDGVLRAAVALKKNPGATMVCGANSRDLKDKLAMYHGEVVVNVDDVVKNVPFHIKAELWVKVPSCNPMQRSLSLGLYVTYALRNAKCAPDELVRLLALYYPDMRAVLAHKEAVSKKYYHYHRETMGELERIKAHVRFKLIGEALYAELNPKNDIRDLLLEWAMRRNPDRPVIIKCHSEYYLLNARGRGYDRDIANISKGEAGRLLGDMTDAGSDIWDTFYDSQYIENRRNKGYAKTRLPAKYSYISPEIRRERKKVEHGIQKDTLDDFPGI